MRTGVVTVASRERTAMVFSPSPDRKLDRNRPSGRVGVEDGLPESARAGVGGVDDGERREKLPGLDYLDRRTFPAPAPGAGRSARREQSAYHDHFSGVRLPTQWPRYAPRTGLLGARVGPWSLHRSIGILPGRIAADRTRSGASGILYEGYNALATPAPVRPICARRCESTGSLVHVADHDTRICALRESSPSGLTQATHRRADGRQGLGDVFQRSPFGLHPE
jgi:hypothetical protein